MGGGCGPFGPNGENVNVAISEKERLRSVDIGGMCAQGVGITGPALAGASSAQRFFSGNQLIQLFECPRKAGDFIALAVTSGDIFIKANFVCPEFLRELEAFVRSGDPACESQYEVRSASWAGVLPDTSRIQYGTAAKFLVMDVASDGKLVGFEITFVNPFPNSAFVVNLAHIHGRTFGAKNVENERIVPLYTRDLDRLVRKDIQRILATRGVTTVEFSKAQIDRLFDGKKTPCVTAEDVGFPLNGGAGWEAGDLLTVIFDEMQQVRSIEVTETIDDATLGGEPAPSDVNGQVNLVLPNGVVSSAAAGDEAVFGLKAKGFVFEFVDPAASICEIVIKTFSHVDTEIPVVPINDGPASTEDAVPVLVIGGNAEKVQAKTTVTILNTDAPGTAHRITITNIGKRSLWAWILIHNGGADTALTVEPENTFDDAAAVSRNALITSFGVAASGDVAFLLQFPGGPGAAAAAATFTPSWTLNVKNDATPAASRTISITVTAEDPAA